MAERFIIDGNFTQSFVGTVGINAQACAVNEDNLASLFYDLDNGSVCYQTSSTDFCYEFIFDSENTTAVSKGGSTGEKARAQTGKFQFVGRAGGGEAPVGSINFPTTEVSKTLFLQFSSASANSGDLRNYLIQNTSSGSIKLSTTTEQVQFNYFSQTSEGNQIAIGSSDFTASLPTPNSSSLTALTKTSDTPFINNQRVCVEVISATGGGSSTTYVTGSSGVQTNLTNLKIIDFSDDVSVISDPLTGELTLQFGSRPEPQSLSVTDPSDSFNHDRFNRVNDSYKVKLNYSLNTTTAVSVSLIDNATGDILQTDNTPGASSTTFDINGLSSPNYRTGSHVFKGSLRVTLADGTEDNFTAISSTSTFELDKDDPGYPSISIISTPSPLKDVQVVTDGNTLGTLKLHVGFSGSGLQFSTSSGATNDYELFDGSNTSSPITIANGLSQTSNFITASNSFRSPSGENDPQVFETHSRSYTQDRIFTFRTGSMTQATISQTEALSRDFLNSNGFNMPLVSDTVNEDPTNILFSINGGSGEYHYFIFSNQFLTTSTPVVKDENNLTVTTVSQIAEYTNIVGSVGYRVFRAGPFGAGILTYKFTNS